MKIKYFVNEEKRTVVCKLYDCYFDLWNDLEKFELSFPKEFKIYVETSKLYIKDEFIGKAKCHIDDKFDIEIGKQLAYKKARLKYDSNKFYNFRECFLLTKKILLNFYHKQQANLDRTFNDLDMLNDKLYKD